LLAPRVSAQALLRLPRFALSALLVYVNIIQPFLLLQVLGVPPARIGAISDQNSEIRLLTEAIDRSIRPLRQARKFTDGGGLYLLVAPTGGRYWRYNYRYEGKYKTLALGIFPDVSLDKARLRHQGAHRWLAAGIDPALKKRQLRSSCRKSNFGARPQIKCS
jgi:hypothetical protein